MFQKRVARTLWPKKQRHTPAVRLLHWTLALSTLALLYTGICIAHPGALPVKNMHRARLWHFTSQYAFIGAFIGRLLYGARCENYRDILPGRKDLHKAPAYLKYELFLSGTEPRFAKYNPLQKILITIWIPVFILQILTGAVLYAPRRLQGLEAAFGGLARVRRLHYLNTLLIGTSKMGHVYLTATSSMEKLKSIFRGYTLIGKS